MCAVHTGLQSAHVVKLAAGQPKQNQVKWVVLKRLLIKTWNDSCSLQRIRKRKTSISVATKRTGYQFVPFLFEGCAAPPEGLWAEALGRVPLALFLCPLPFVQGCGSGQGDRCLVLTPRSGAAPGPQALVLHARLHFSPLQCSHELICLIRWAYPSSVHFGKGNPLRADYKCFVSLCGSEFRMAQ